MTKEQIVKSFREKYGISARRLMELMGITTISNYNRLESGRRPLTLQHKATLRLLQGELEFLTEMADNEKCRARINEIIKS